MPASENKEVVRRHLERLSAGDVEGAAAEWADTARNHGRPITRQDLTGILTSLLGLKERHSIHEMVAEGEWVAVRTTCEGVHAIEPQVPVNGGIFVGIPPTGRTYTVQHIHLFRLVGGKIVEHWANRDDLGAARQIGRELTAPKG